MNQKISIRSVARSIGLVFGDIGTSPIYTLAVIDLVVPPTPIHITYVISLIVWTLLIIVTLQYAFLAMKLSKNGEGGTIVLREIYLSLTQGKNKVLLPFLAVIGVCLMVGDCVITPAISILSAVEGINLIPKMNDLTNSELLLVALVITFLLFWFQRNGSDRVARSFSPVMIIWFLALATFGLISLLQTPEILIALSPLTALSFFINEPHLAFLSLSLVILCSTGAEALFADMGHVGRDPICIGWIFVFIAILLAYLGQGAYIIRAVPMTNPLYEMVVSIAPDIYIPFLILSVCATVIASQAVISGLFSITYQAVNTRLLPRIDIIYTSSELMTQIYVNSANWLLCGMVIFTLFIFRSSDKLASAYGISVCGTMLITGILMTTIFYHLQKRALVFASLLVTLVDLIFFISLLQKIPSGGYWSFIIASIPLTFILIYTTGEKRLRARIETIPIVGFISEFKSKFIRNSRLDGEAIFLSPSISLIPSYIYKTMFTHNIIYSRSIIVTITREREPYGIRLNLENASEGLILLEILCGYMEKIHMMDILTDAGIKPTIIFTSQEDIIPRQRIWWIYRFIKRINPDFSYWFDIPPGLLYGVVTRCEI